MALQDSPGLTPLGKLVMFLFVVAMIGGGVYLLKDQMSGGPSDQPQDIDMSKFGNDGAAPQDKDGVEAVDYSGITTVKEYTFVPSEKLPPVKGTGNYTWDDDNPVVVFPINVWVGWLPIVAANHGFAANEDSIFFKKYGFKVELELIDDPVMARDAFATGKSHVLWGTLDMMVLFADSLMKDSRTSPRIFQQIDWSNGGDGIVARSNIRSIKDLVGKTVVYAQNSPSQYYLNSLLISAGIQPSKVKHKFTSNAFEAATAFVSDPKIDACVSWAPDIYNITDRVKGTHLLSTTADANKLIADVWAVRADFAKEHPDIVKGLVAGIFHGMREAKDNPGPAYSWMADGYGMSVEEVQGMALDAHTTNFAENKEFFLNANNATNFERSWKNISLVYRELGLINAPRRFDQVVDFSIIQELDKEGTFKEDKNLYISSYPNITYSKVSAEAPILTQTIRINFFPNSSNLYEHARDQYGTILKNKLYDPNVDSTLETIGRLVGQFDAAVVAITGHTDSSMKGKVDKSAVVTLSGARAEAVRKALIEKFNFDPKRFHVKGIGWDQPAAKNQPNNHALNRRVEISIYQPESGGN